jgi:hypothetical protein
MKKRKVKNIIKQYQLNPMVDKETIKSTVDILNKEIEKISAEIFKLSRLASTYEVGSSHRSYEPFIKQLVLDRKNILDFLKSIYKNGIED